MNNIGENLKYFRIQNKMTANEFADILGLSHGGYGKYERNERLPSLPVLINMSKALNVPTDVLLGLSNEQSIQVDEEWLMEIKYASINKKEAIKVIWDQIKNL